MIIGPTYSYLPALRDEFIFYLFEFAIISMGWCKKDALAMELRLSGINPPIYYNNYDAY